MARKDAIEIEGTGRRVAAQHHVWRRARQWPPCSGTHLRANTTALHSHLARRQSYGRGFSLRFVERANYLSPEMTRPRPPRGFLLADESTTISKETLCQLQDR